MKRLISLLIGFSLIASLMVACGTTEETESVSTPSEEVHETIVEESTSIEPEISDEETVGNIDVTQTTENNGMKYETGITYESKSTKAKAVIDLDQYVTVTAKGYNGVGEPEITVDIDAFCADYDNQLTLASGYEDTEAGRKVANGKTAAYVFICDVAWRYELDKEENLSNGDIVTLTWDLGMMSEPENLAAYGVKSCKCDTIIYTVSGLREKNTEEKTYITSVDEIPDKILETLTTNGRRSIAGQNRWDDPLDPDDNLSEMYIKEESANYIGGYCFVKNDYSGNKLYLIYEVIASQIGLDDKNYIEDGGIHSDRVLFGYYWYYPVFDVTLNYDDNGIEVESISSTETKEDKCTNEVTFTTYRSTDEGIETITRDYCGYYTLDDLYEDIVAKNGEGYILSNSNVMPTDND